MSAPYEIQSIGMTAWLGAANAAEPLDLDAAPSGGTWTKLGTLGSDEYDEDGVTFTPEQNIEVFRGLGKTGPLKAWRTEEDLTVELTVYDTTVENVAKALNNVAVTSTAAGASISGAKSVPLVQGQDVALFAILLRTDSGSPYGDSYKSQFWIPVVYQGDNLELVYKKGEPVGVKFTFKALQDSSNGFGKYRAQNAVKTS